MTYPSLAPTWMNFIMRDSDDDEIDDDFATETWHRLKQ